ncbi:MAG: ATP-binding protein [Kiritimatiellales bacterium]
MSTKKQSNPFSAGGGGSNFEMNIQSAFAVLMLGQVSVPCLPPWPIKKIKLQGKYAGYETDDCIVFVNDSKTGSEAKLFTQIKHTVTITETDEIFGEVIQAAWNDFTNNKIFDPTIDSIALITGPMSATDIVNVRPLLEWARHSEDAQDYLKKVHSLGFSSEIKKRKLAAIRTQLKNANEGNEIDDDTFWQFIKCFHLLSYDLDVDSGNTYPLLLAILRHFAGNTPENSWARLKSVVQSANQNAGTLLPSDLLSELEIQSQLNINEHWHQDHKKLQEHGEYILDGIKSDIGGLTLPRNDFICHLHAICEETSFVLIQGERGCGKSSLIRQFINTLDKSTSVYCLRAEDFDKPHLDAVFTSIGLHGSLGTLEENLALIPRRFLVIESLEKKLLELTHTGAFIDLFTFLKKRPEWTVIASGRDYAHSQIVSNFLTPHDIRYRSLTLTGFTKEEVSYFCDQLIPMQQFKTNEQLKLLFQNPFMARLAYQASSSGTRLSSTEGEHVFRVAIWNDVISKESCRVNGLPIKRKNTFVDISVRRAKNMVFGIPQDGLDPEALLALEGDQLVRRDVHNGLVSPTHDVLEDWALERFIDEAYTAGGNDIKNFISAVGTEPAMNRAFRLWLTNKLKTDPHIWNFLSDLFKDNTEEEIWRDEAITAILLDENLSDTLEKLKDSLFENNGQLLKRFCFLLRIVSKEPSQLITQEISKENNTTIPQFLIPTGTGWNIIIQFLYKNKDSINETYYKDIVAVLSEYAQTITITSPASDIVRATGLLGIHMLQFFRSDYRNHNRLKKLLTVIIKTTVAIGPEIKKLLRGVLDIEDRYNRPDYADLLLDLALTDPITAILCKYQPELIIDVAWRIWMIDRCPWPPSERFYGEYFRRDVGDCFAINDHHSGTKFFPASGSKGPFFPLLRFHPEIGLDFILRICNFATESYIISGLDGPSEFDGMSPDNDSFKSADEIVIEINLPNGQTRLQYCTQRLWSAYRSATVTPCLLQTALMALENWLIETVDRSEDKLYLEALFLIILSESNSVLTTAVLASVATGFPDKLGRASLPLLSVPKFYEKDLIRAAIQESRERGINLFGGLFNPDPYADFYAEERKTAAARTWRNESLETLVFKLQFGDIRDEVFNILDQLKDVVGDNERWKFRFHRIDSRCMNPVADKEKKQIFFVPKNMDSDLKEKQSKTFANMAQLNRFVALTLWADAAFKNEVYENSSYGDWTEALSEAKELWNLIADGKVREVELMQAGSICRAAVIFLRDHGSKLKEDDVEWAIERVCTAILPETRDNDYSIDAMDVTDHSGAAAVASILPILFDFFETEDDRNSLKMLIVTALTHVNKNVRESAAKGIREYLWSRDSEFAKICFYGTIAYAKAMIDARENKRKSSEGDRIFEENDPDWIVTFCEKMISGNVDVPELSFTFNTHCGWNMLVPCLIVPNGTTDHVQINFLSRMLELCAEIEAKEMQYSGNKIDEKIFMKLPRHLAEIVFFSPDEEKKTFLNQLNDICQKAPNIVHSFLINYLCIADLHNQVDSYWDIWRTFSSELGKICIGHKPAKFLPYREQDVNTLISGYLFYDFGWSRVRPDDHVINLGKDDISSFCAEHGANPLVFEAYCRFLYDFPDLFVPNGLLTLSMLQLKVGGSKLMSGTNTVFYLKVILQRYLLETGEASIPEKLHSACKVLLDALVEQASSNAYFLRERLIRSIRRS